jgi:hypothetical protein
MKYVDDRGDYFCKTLANILKAKSTEDLVADEILAL